MQQLSAVITTHALNTADEFPFVTIPEFEVAGGYADGMGGIMMAAFCPFITDDQYEKWIGYTEENKNWIVESARLKLVHPSHRDAVHGTFQDHEHDRRLESVTIPQHLYTYMNGTRIPTERADGKKYAPLWQSSPAEATAVNADMLSDSRIREIADLVSITNQTILSRAYPASELFDWMFDPIEKPRKVEPHAFLVEPVYKTFDYFPEQVGILVGLTSWRNIMDRLLPDSTRGIHVVASDSCGKVHTYQLDGQRSTWLGEGDFHQEKYDSLKISSPLEIYDTVVEGMCTHTLDVYPTSLFEEQYKTSTPAIYTTVVAMAFLVTAVLLFVYDVMVGRRQKKTMSTALRTNALVESLFPENVRERLLQDAEKRERKNGKREGFTIGKNGILDKIESDDIPIADFFPNVTVMFADISGFTAWSSTREPAQVFQLLETIYGALDVIAKRRGIFKVETVGDCYVAASGLPEPMADHAVAMARFARDCMFKMNELTQNLEACLGPDTADLAFRIGIHSGAVTAGVLRGQNARFQLFGDTMNTAARMESTGLSRRIQISSETAALLEQAGKKHWLKKRDESVLAKGKGSLDTFWIKIDVEGSASVKSVSNTDVSENGDQDIANEVKDPAQLKSLQAGKDKRLIDWNTAVLFERVKALVRERKFAADQNFQWTEAAIGQSVRAQLEQYVAGVAAMYKDNPFHNFEHASHVTMSVTKLLSRVVGSGDGNGVEEDGKVSYTKDITHCALTQFSVVFSALIHDVDHTGVPNARLIEEQVPIASIYKKSIAENNSIDLSMDFLMSEEFDELRHVLCPNEAEFSRFKELVTNAVLATDIVDKDLKADRNARWVKVFSEEESETDKKSINHYKARIVLEHMIQASDVCHTMQHWHIFRKWNERLFEEMYKAYKEGRASKDPAEFWYQGEIGFFDFYIIPLAKKLAECGVFGVSSDEYLNYAKMNRKEWEERGKEVVAQMVEKICPKYNI